MRKKTKKTIRCESFINKFLFKLKHCLIEEEYSKKDEIKLTKTK